MNDQEREVLKLAAERLLAVADGATLEWVSTGDMLNLPWEITAGCLGGERVRIRPPAAPTEPVPSQAVIDACKRLGVEAWKLDRFRKGDRILGNGYVEADGKDCYGEWCLPAEWWATGDQQSNSTVRYWHVRPIGQAKPPELPPKPSQEWLDYAERWGCDIVGRRTVLRGDLCAGEVAGDKNDGFGPWIANSDMPHLTRWILRKREPARPPAPELPCPPKPTPEQVAAARLPDGRRVKEPTVCEVPNGRPWFYAENRMVFDGELTPSDHFGRRRWIAEPADDVVTPWALDTKHAGKVVIHKGNGGWGIITGVRDGQFTVAGWGKIAPMYLLRDWTHDGRPCGEVQP